MKDLLNRDLKNEEIEQVLTENGIDIDATPVCIDVIPTGKSNDEGIEWLMCYFLAEVKLANSNATMSKLQLKLKKWGTGDQKLRAMEAIPADVIESMGIEVGKKLEDATLRVTDTIEKPFDKAKPRQTRDGRILVDSNNNPVYRETQLIGVEELAENPHVVISCKPVVVGDATTSTASSTTKQEVLQS